MTQSELTQAENTRWMWLYKIGVATALISLILIPISMAAFFIWPPFPKDILTVIQEDTLAGLMSLDFLYLLGNFFGIPLFLVLFVTLRRVDGSWALIALTLGFIGLVCIVLARPILEMLALSDQYAAASATDKATYLAASEAILSLFHGTAFHAHYLLGSASLLINSFLMLRSDAFGRATAWVGIGTNIVALGLYVPVIGVYLSLLSVVGYLIWYGFIARSLLHLVHSSP